MIETLKRARRLLDGGMIRYTSSDVEAERKLVAAELDVLIQKSEAELAQLDAYMDAEEKKMEEAQKTVPKKVHLPVLP
jgi:hypothetical protein